MKQVKKDWLIIYLLVFGLYSSQAQNYSSISAELEDLNKRGKEILFDTGKASIKPRSEESLKIIANILNNFPYAKFAVQGHTEDAGSENLNLDLSQKRAEAVKNYLIELGIDAQRLTAIGYGESVPLRENNSAQGRKTNRRIEFKIEKFDALILEPYSFKVDIPSDINNGPSSSMNEYYLVKLDEFYSHFFRKYSAGNQYKRISPGKEIRIELVKGETTNDQNIYESFQIITAYIRAENHASKEAKITLSLIMDGKWYRSKAKIDTDFMRKNGNDFDKSKYEDNLKSYINQLYNEFENYLKT